MSRNAKGPDFLGIGPPKTATNWTYAALACHPAVFMPPVKEIRHLWAQQFLPGATYLSRWSSDHWYFRVFRAQALDCAASAIRDLRRGRPAAKRLRWCLRYALLPHTDTWYDKLFDGALVSGDITPKYCELPSEFVESLARRYPRTRILVSLRDPVEREWSRAKMNLCRRQNRRPDQVAHAEWIEHFREPRQAAASDYVGLIERWTRQFGEERVLVFYFDEVLLDAWATFRRLCAFLELAEPPEAIRRAVEQPRNVGLREGIPGELEAYLFEMHRARIEALVEARPSDPFPSRWLAHHESPAR